MFLVASELSTLTVPFIFTSLVFALYLPFHSIIAECIRMVIPFPQINLWIMVQIFPTCWDLMMKRWKNSWGFTSLSTGLYWYLSGHTCLLKRAKFSYIFSSCFQELKICGVMIYYLSTYFFYSDHEGGNVSAHTGHLVWMRTVCPCVNCEGLTFCLLDVSGGSFANNTCPCRSVVLFQIHICHLQLH